jgi:molybdate transport system permease protein
LQDSLWSFVFEFSGIVLAQFLTTVGLAVRMIKNTFDDIPTQEFFIAVFAGICI